MWAGDTRLPTKHVGHDWYDIYKAIVEERKQAKKAKERAKK
jgi:hypothetical protein